MYASQKSFKVSKDNPTDGKSLGSLRAGYSKLKPKKWRNKPTKIIQQTYVLNEGYVFLSRNRKL